MISMNTRKLRTENWINRGNIEDEFQSVKTSRRILELKYMRLVEVTGAY